MDLDAGSGPHTPAIASRHRGVETGRLGRGRDGQRSRGHSIWDRPRRGSPGARERPEGRAMSRGRPTKRRAHAPGTSTPPVASPTRARSRRGPLGVALFVAVMLAGVIAWRAWFGRPVAPPGDATAEAGRLEPAQAATRALELGRAGRRVEDLPWFPRAAAAGGSAGHWNLGVGASKPSL